MAVRKLKESKTLKNYEIADMLVANGFGNEEEGYLDYFLPDNPKYVASVNLDDMGSYIDDLDEGEHVSLPYANNADRKILRTEEDVEEFLSFIQELNYSDMFESKTRKTGKRIKEELDYDAVTIDDIVDICDHIKEDADKIKRVASNYPENYNSAWRNYTELKDRLIDIETMLYELWG